MSHPHDRGYRKIFSFWKMLQQLFDGYVDQEWKSKLDFKNSEKIDGTFILEGYEKKETDILYKVPLRKKNSHIYLYVLIEHQSSVDYTMAFRVLVYLTRVWLHVFQNTDKRARESKNFKFPPVFPIVLYNGKGKWTAKTSMKELVESGDLFADFLPNVKYHLIDIPRLDLDKVENLQTALSSVFLLEREIEAKDFKNACEKAISFLKNEEDDELWTTIAQWIFMYSKRKYPDKYDVIEDVDFKKNNRKDVVAMLETMPDKLIAFGKKEGVKKGLTFGVKNSIINILNARFSQVSDITMQKIESINNIDLLNKLVQNAALANSLKDFENLL